MTPKILPKLREDLEIKVMDNDEDGFPVHVIYDGVAHRFYLIGWMEFEILTRWKLRNITAIVESVNQETTLNITEKNVGFFASFLARQELLQIESDTSLHQLINKIPKKNYFDQLIKNYLFFLIPLVNPDRFLDKTIRHVKFLFSKTTLIILCIMTLFGLYFVVRQWDNYIGTFNYLFNFSNMAIFVLAIIIVKIIHELGHAYTAKYFGCRVGSIGIAFIVLWPVLFTDTTDVWKLRKKSQRIAVAAAGMIAELSLAVIAIFLWNFMPEGLPKFLMVFISTTSILSSLLINLNPVLRFDGYYLFADLVGVSNLRSTAFAVGSWKLREWLFKFGENPPILYPKKKEKLLIFYAYFTWLYRFFLILAIALLVYHYFFKALGIILMLVELLYFIIIPLASELKTYWLRRKNLTLNKNTVLTFSITTLLIILFIIPWNTKVSGPATLEYSNQTKLYTKTSGSIDKIDFTNGQFVHKDQILMSFNNLNLDHDIKKAQIEIERVTIQLQNQIEKTDNINYQDANYQELQSKQNALRDLLNEQHKLTIYAPFSGIIISNNQGYQHDVWLDKDTFIAELINPTDPVVYAYIQERDLSRVHIGANAVFYPEQTDAKQIQLKVAAIDAAAIDILPSPYLASIYGGKILVTPNQKGDLEVQEALYRVQLIPVETVSNLAHIVSGDVQISGTRESYASRLWTLISSTFIKESGF